MGLSASMEVECKALRTGVGVHRLVDRAHFDATDRHRARFVHNMSTCEIKGLSAGQVAFGLSVDRGGKLVGQFFADVGEEAIRIELAAGRREAVVAHWTSHRVADRIRFEDVDGLAVIAVVGPTSGALLNGVSACDVNDLSNRAWAETTIAGETGRIRRNDDRLDLPGWDVTVAEAAADTVLAALCEAGALAISDEAWIAVRVANGVPADTIDMNEENIPLESDHLVRAISWDKGCYIGQEVIARMHYRGKPNRHLRGIRITGAPPTSGSTLTAPDGKEVGVVGTVCPASESGDVIALAVVKRHFAESGAVLATANGDEACVVPLPFSAV